MRALTVMVSAVVMGSSRLCPVQSLQIPKLRCQRSFSSLTSLSEQDPNNNFFDNLANSMSNFYNDMQPKSYPATSKSPVPFTSPNGATPVKPRIDKDIRNIFAQNISWRTRKLFEDPQFFEKLGATHQPKYMWIGCADARVPANEIMGEDAGSVFVVRNVANLVVNTDINLMASLQYAVNALKVDHIIVCGHYDCGGVRASMQKKDHMPPLENWLRNIRDVYRLHRTELDSIDDPEARHRRLVELNVIEQCINLFKTGAIQRRRVETYKEGIALVDSGAVAERPYVTPRIHACVFDPKVGKLERLEVDFKNFIADLHGIYDLYPLDDDDLVQGKKPHVPQPVGNEYSGILSGASNS